jgi:hypothetical protein
MIRFLPHLLLCLLLIGPVRAEADPLGVELGPSQGFPSRGDASPPAARPQLASLRWTAGFQSTAGRPIETAVVGRGPRPLLILRSLYGNEPETVELMDGLLRLLAGIDVPRDVRLMLVRSPNPDGLAERISTNHNGVDLNRNFPSTWFTVSPTQQTGPHPASEVETQSLLRMLKETRPERVIHVRGSLGRRPLVLLNEHWWTGFDRSMLPRSVEAGRFEGGFKAGSLEEFVSLRMQAELATVHLPPRGFEQFSPETRRMALSSYAPLPPGTYGRFAPGFRTSCLGTANRVESASRGNLFRSLTRV